MQDHHNPSLSRPVASRAPLQTVLDPQGAPAPRCCCLRPGGGLLTVARQEVGSPRCAYVM